MLLQTNSYIVPKERRAEHQRLLRRFRQTLARLGCEHFEVYEQVGANWTKWKDALHYVDYTVAALIVVGIVYLVLRNRSRRGKDEAAADASA